MSLEKRISRLEATQAAYELREMYARVAAECGMDPDELMEEAEAFLRLPLAEQLAEVDRLHADMIAEGLTMDDAEDIKATLVREYRP